MMRQQEGGVKEQLKPLLAWLHSNSAQLKAAGRWPLQQEDIPENLLPLWKVYQAHADALKKAGVPSKRHASRPAAGLPCASPSRPPLLSPRRGSGRQGLHRTPSKAGMPAQSPAPARGGPAWFEPGSAVASDLSCLGPTPQDKGARPRRALALDDSPSSKAAPEAECVPATDEKAGPPEDLAVDLGRRGGTRKVLGALFQQADEGQQQPQVQQPEPAPHPHPLGGLLQPKQLFGRQAKAPAAAAGLAPASAAPAAAAAQNRAGPPSLDPFRMAQFEEGVSLQGVAGVHGLGRSQLDLKRTRPAADGPPGLSQTHLPFPQLAGQARSTSRGRGLPGVRGNPFARAGAGASNNTGAARESQPAATGTQGSGSSLGPQDGLGRAGKGNDSKQVMASPDLAAQPVPAAAPASVAASLASSPAAAAPGAAEGGSGGLRGAAGPAPVLATRNALMSPPRRTAYTPIKAVESRGIDGASPGPSGQASLMMSPGLLRPGMHKVVRKGLAFQATAVERERFQAIGSPGPARHHLLQSPSRTALGLGGLGPGSGGLRAPLVPTAAGATAAPSPMLRAPAFDIADVLLGITSPSPARRPTPRGGPAGAAGKPPMSPLAFRLPSSQERRPQARQDEPSSPTRSALQPTQQQAAQQQHQPQAQQRAANLFAFVSSAKAAQPQQQLQEEDPNPFAFMSPPKPRRQPQHPTSAGGAPAMPDGVQQGPGTTSTTPAAGTGATATGAAAATTGKKRARSLAEDMLEPAEAQPQQKKQDGTQQVVAMCLDTTCQHQHGGAPTGAGAPASAPRSRSQSRQPQRRASTAARGCGTALVAAVAEAEAKAVRPAAKRARTTAGADRAGRAAGARGRGKASQDGTGSEWESEGQQEHASQQESSPSKRTDEGALSPQPRAARLGAGVRRAAAVRAAALQRKRMGAKRGATGAGAAARAAARRGRGADGAEEEEEAGDMELGAWEVAAAEGLFGESSESAPDESSDEDEELAGMVGSPASEDGSGAEEEQEGSEDEKPARRRRRASTASAAAAPRQRRARAGAAAAARTPGPPGVAAVEGEEAGQAKPPAGSRSAPPAARPTARSRTSKAAADAAGAAGGAAPKAKAPRKPRAPKKAAAAATGEAAAGAGAAAAAGAAGGASGSGAGGSALAAARASAAALARGVVPGATGGVRKRTAAAAGGGGTSRGGGSSVSRNFVKYNMGNKAKHSFGFQSRSAATGRTKASRTRLRRVNGKIIRAQFKAPAMAGQGGDFLEGFRQDSRCFRCGQTGHWASNCPFDKGVAADQLQAAEADVEDAEAADAGGPDAVGASPNWKARMAREAAARRAEALAGMGGSAGTGSAMLGPAAAAAGVVPAVGPGGIRAAGAGGGAVLGGAPGIAPAAGPRPVFDLFSLLPEDLVADLRSTCCAPAPGTATEAQPATDAAAAAGEAGGAAQVPATAAQLDASRMSDDQLRAVLRAVWGHGDFRFRQLTLVRAVLSGKSMLGVLPTGAGKSLCYQLPALLLPGLTVVVSPLLALMRDQLARLPPGVPGAMLEGSQTRSEAEAVLQDAARGAIKLLYVAPEKLLNPAVLDALRRLPSRLPLVCVDEAHCVAEWGHSFRPAYFRLGHVLRAVLRPTSTLALTATATRPTQAAIIQVLGLPPEVVRESPLRDNLRLQVIHADGATQSGRAISWLAKALKPGGVLEEVESMIVYVNYQAQADEVAEQLKRVGIRAVAYHAGKAQDERLRVQEAFCAGGARVVVATVAFGMGVDKQELGAVVHLQLPRSLEDYVQQVGRAGRDGREARAYLLLDKDDYVRLRSLAHSASAELASVERLLRAIFAPLAEAKAKLQQEQGEGAAAAGGSKPLPAFGALPTKDTATELDLTEEVMETVMSYLQGHDGRGLITALPSTSAFLDVRFHRSSPADLAAKHPVVAALVAAKPRVTRGVHKIPMARMVASAGMSPSAVLAQLAELARRQEIHFELSKPRALAWRVVAREAPNLPALARTLHDRLQRQLKVGVRRLDVVWSLMSGSAALGPQDPALQERLIRSHVARYFESEREVPDLPEFGSAVAAAAVMGGPAAAAATAAGGIGAQQLDEEGWGAGVYVVRGVGAGDGEGGDRMEEDWGGEGAQDGRSGAAAAAGAAGQGQRKGGVGALPVDMAPERAGVQVAAFLHSQKQQVLSMPRKITGTAVARIFHGLSTPAFPSDQWLKCGFWGKFTAWDFGYIAHVATRQVQAFYSGAAQEQDSP